MEGPETIRRAHAVHPICDLQIEYSLMSRGPEPAIFPLLEEPGIAVTAYGVLSRGLLSGASPHGDPGDFRAYLPRFRGGEPRAQPEARRGLGRDRAREGFNERSTRHRLGAGSGLRAQGPVIIPVIGSRNRTQLEDSLIALDIELTPEDMARIEEAVPAGTVAGTRYGEEQMKALDSERSDR